ncbi:STAS-like domain-containing protein [Brevibacillus agri]|uniref:STAS-like domain-containing protein n=1 Tax=Brevibacillus agri TaxID=51101 RepID=UPI001C8E860C|nr:STAS-like domain-containing protein [Brevibacillus agri]MBY0055005.1 STAS-like domain-containing protein [Brevibacillus agri]
MVINILDHVERCYSNADGDIIFALIKPKLAAGQKVTISFSGVDSVPSSFVNSAFIALLDDFTFEHVRSHLKFINTTKQINEMIKSRFSFEANERKKLINV